MQYPCCLCCILTVCAVSLLLVLYPCSLCCILAPCALSLLLVLYPCCLCSILAACALFIFSLSPSSCYPYHSCSASISFAVQQDDLQTPFNISRTDSFLFLSGKNLFPSLHSRRCMYITVTVRSQILLTCSSFPAYILLMYGLLPPASR